MSTSNPGVTLLLTTEEKKQLQRMADAEGVSLSLFMYRRVFNKPDAERPRGRKPKHARDQDEGLFAKTG